MKVIKRDGRTIDFDRAKIQTAIEKANKEVRGKEKATKEEIDEIISYIEDLGKKRMLVEDIQDVIEEKLMELDKYELAKKYIVYRYTRALVRKSNTTDESILGLIRNENKELAEENSNKNTMLASTQRDYIARDTKDTYEWFISEKLKNIIIKEKFAMKLVNPENKTEQEECRKNTRRTPTLKTGKVSSIKNETTIRSYIDKCLELVQEHKEYLMYVASYEPTIEPEMQDFLDNNLLEGKSPKIYVTQPGRTNYMVDIITEKDHIWKAIDSQISDEDIDKLEGELNVILPLSYKSYLKYKHFYEIFWDIDVFLYPKPIHSWDKILIEENQEMQEEILDEGYFAIGRYSDHGVIVLKLTDDENKEGGVFLFDCESQKVKVLEPTFTEFLNQILHNPKPVLQELKSWEKKMYKME